MKTNMGLKWYQSTAYDLTISRLVFFFNLKSLGPFRGACLVNGGCPVQI
jgi:hypothetical protein